MHRTLNEFSTGLQEKNLHLSVPARTGVKTFANARFVACSGFSRIEGARCRASNATPKAFADPQMRTAIVVALSASLEWATAATARATKPESNVFFTAF